MKLHLNAKRIYDMYGEKLRLSRKEFYAAMQDLDSGIYPDKMGIPPGDYAATFIRACHFRALDILLEGNDWEAIVPEETKNGHEIYYLNFGDPYVPTILYCEAWKRPFRFAPFGWGDYIKMSKKIICPACDGDGIERCSNPDHGFIDAIGGEIGRLGCPVCGHDEQHRVMGSSCPDCNGSGFIEETKRRTAYDI